eukprot:Lankesteria_metandrocarpae@DN5172_c0_g1_i4.p2
MATIVHVKEHVNFLLGEAMMMPSGQAVIEAKSTQQKPAEMICKYYSQGRCVKKNCQFRHDGEPKNHHTTKPQLKPTCRLFSAGNCDYGNKCRYAHNAMTDNHDGFGNEHTSKQQTEIQQQVERFLGIKAIVPDSCSNNRFVLD